MLLYLSLSGCGAVGSALDWGSRGRKFKSSHSDHKADNSFELPALFFVFSNKRRLELLSPKANTIGLARLYPRTQCDRANVGAGLDLPERC